MNSNLPAMLRAIVKYRYLILAAFMLLFGVDMIITGIRIMLFELIIFLLGVFVGVAYMTTHEQKPTEEEPPPDLNTQLNRRLYKRHIAQ